MEPVLTQAELEAIYSAMQADVDDEKPIDDYVLASDHAYNMRCLKAWTRAAKSVFLDIESLFVRRLAVRDPIELQDTHIVDDERESSSPGADGMVPVVPLAQSDPDSEVRVLLLGSQRVLLGVQRDTAYRYVARRAGIPQEDLDGSRPMTPLEKRLLHDFFAEISEVLGALSPTGQAQLLPDEPEDFWVDREPRGPWVNVRFSAGENPRASLWVRGPSDLFVPREERKPVDLRHKMRATQVELVMELGRFTLKAHDLWHLQKGDVFPLRVAVDDPLDVLVGGVCKMKGKPTVSRGHVAFEVVDAKQEAENERIA